MHKVYPRHSISPVSYTHLVSHTNNGKTGFFYSEEKIDGKIRRWYTYVPSDYKAGTGVPLVVAIHGYSSAIHAFTGDSRWQDVAEKNGFIVVFPPVSYTHLADEIAICHSKLSNRAKQEQRFRSGKARIMIATSAFGMGVNIPDIRLIIVSQLPFSAASFYQMAGRAGRDRKRAKALLLWNDADFQMNLDICLLYTSRCVEETVSI